MARAVGLMFEGAVRDSEDISALKETVETRLEDMADLRLVKVEYGGSKERFGKYGNVLLTSAERDKLEEMFGVRRASELVDRLSVKLETKGYRFKSHFAVIVEWEAEDGKAGGGTSFDADDFFRAAVARSYEDK